MIFQKNPSETWKTSVVISFCLDFLTLQGSLLPVNGAIIDRWCRIVSMSGRTAV